MLRILPSIILLPCHTPLKTPLPQSHPSRQRISTQTGSFGVDEKQCPSLGYASPAFLVPPDTTPQTQKYLQEDREPMQHPRQPCFRINTRSFTIIINTRSKASKHVQPPPPSPLPSHNPSHTPSKHRPSPSPPSPQHLPHKQPKPPPNRPIPKDTALPIALPPRTFTRTHGFLVRRLGLRVAVFAREDVGRVRRGAGSAGAVGEVS